MEGYIHDESVRNLEFFSPDEETRVTCHYAKENYYVLPGAGDHGDFGFWVLFDFLHAEADVFDQVYRCRAWCFTLAFALDFDAGVGLVGWAGPNDHVLSVVPR